MNETREKIEKALLFLREISVKGEDVERMAAAKIQLAQALQALAAGGANGDKEERKK